LLDGSLLLPMGKNPSGFLVYTQDGIVSAQLSRAVDKSYATGGTQQGKVPYIGYCGSFAVNDQAQEVVHLPKVAHDPEMVGSPLRRKFQFDGERLILRTVAGEAGANVVEAQLVWRRFLRV